MLDFPASPTNGQIFTSGAASWRWDGTKWVPNTSTTTVIFPIETVSGTTYTTVAADKSKWKRTTNAAAVTITIAANVNAADDEITFSQGGAGLVTFAAGSGMTVNSRGGMTAMAGQYGVAGLKFVSATQATLFGDLA